MRPRPQVPSDPVSISPALCRPVESVPIPTGAVHAKHRQAVAGADRIPPGHPTGRAFLRPGDCRSVPGPVPKRWATRQGLLLRMPFLGSVREAHISFPRTRAGWLQGLATPRTRWSFRSALFLSSKLHRRVPAYYSSLFTGFRLGGGASGCRPSVPSTCQDLGGEAAHKRESPLFADADDGSAIPSTMSARLRWPSGGIALIIMCVTTKSFPL